MAKLYKVFISSTSEDLKEERQAVIAALLEGGYVPSGMELFGARADRTEYAIAREIDQCDFLVVIVADRYGSTTSDGLSFTEWECEYAERKGIPILPFFRKGTAREPK